MVRGVPTPKLEGWILCLLGIPNTDTLSPAGADRALAEAGVEAKSTAVYVEIAASRPLPAGDGSLARWLADANAAFCRLLEGR